MQSRFATALTLGCGALLIVACSDDNGPDGNDGSGTGSGTYQCASGGGGAGGGIGIVCSATAEVADDTAGTVANNNAVTSVQVGSLAAGESTTVTFRIRNTANAASAAPLYIDKIEMVYAKQSPLETDTNAFECWDAAQTERCAAHTFVPVVPSGLEKAGFTNQERFVIRYTKFDEVKRNAVVKITFGNDTQWASKEYRLIFETKQGAPKVKISPDTLIFPFVKKGETDTKAFTVTNTGDAILRVHQLDFVADKAFKLSALDQEWVPNAQVVLDPPAEVLPGTSKSFDVTFAPADAQQKQGTINVLSNDPSAPEGVKLVLLANSSVPCMKIDPSTNITFGGVKIGDCAERDVTIRSCGTQALEIEGVTFGDGTTSDEFTLKFDKMKKQCPAETVRSIKDYGDCPDIDPAVGPTPEKLLAIGPNGKATFTVTYCPEDISAEDPATGTPKPDTAIVDVTSNAFSADGSVKLEGIGVKEICPTAKITVKEGEEVIPQTVLHLKGDQSKAAGGGTIKAHKWSVKQPTGSNQVFVPGPSFPNPTFTANAAGEYEFCLDVWDQNDQKSCATACVPVNVIPEEAIHVELLWKTPADPDETDTGPAAGSDMDLHFTHYLANGPDIDCDGTPDPWFSNPFDTFWFNPNPNWGSSNPAVNDDPSLDLDDTDGAGPENLNLDQPEGTVGNPVQYAVGVHYWNDHGYGTSYATVNVYVLGILAFQITDVKMNVLDMWYVGKVNWPNGMTGGIKEPIEPCYQSGDACSGTGKMWQPPPGEWCITPCYFNPGFSATATGASTANCKK